MGRKWYISQCWFLVMTWHLPSNKSLHKQMTEPFYWRIHAYHLMTYQWHTVRVFETKSNAHNATGCFLGEHVTEIKHGEPKYALYKNPICRWISSVKISRLEKQMSTTLHLPSHQIWWRHGMKLPSAWLNLCQVKPPVTDGFPSQRTRKAKFWRLLCCKPEQAVPQTQSNCR